MCLALNIAFGIFKMVTMCLLNKQMISYKLTQIVFGSGRIPKQALQIIMARYLLPLVLIRSGLCVSIHPRNLEETGYQKWVVKLKWDLLQGKVSK